MKKHWGKRIGTALLCLCLCLESISFPVSASASADTNVTQMSANAGDTQDASAKDAGEADVSAGDTDEVTVPVENSGEEIPVEGDSVEGVLADDVEVANVSATSLADAREYLYQELLSFHSNIDMSAYNIPVADGEAFFLNTLKEHPDLYYVVAQANVYNDGSIVTKYAPQYSSSQYNTVAFAQVRLQALGRINSSMSDLEKAIVLHDYLTVNCAQIYSGENSENAYGALVEQKANSKGYAMAYKYLLNEAGIECLLVESATQSGTGETWNLVNLDGSYYHVDVYCDDPYPDSFGQARHQFMFRSDTAWRADTLDGGCLHNSTDWKILKDGSYQSVTASNTKYDNYFWITVESPIVIDGSYCYYVREDYSSYDAVYDLVKGNLSGSVSTVLHSDLGKNGINSGTGYQYRGNTTRVFKLGDVLYYNTATAIYTVKPDGTDKRLILNADTSQGEFYGIGLVYDIGLEVAMPRYLLTTSPNVTGDAYIHDIPMGSGGEVVDPDDPDPNPDQPATLSVPTITVNGSSLVMSDGYTLVDSGTTITLQQAEGATMYYTTNGTKPTTSSSRYGSPIPITKTTILRVLANNGTISSDIVQQNFKVASNDLILDKQTIPSLSGNTTTTITATTLPTTKAATDITWTSSNPGVATVTKNSDGSATVKGITQGDATITATIKDWQNRTVTATCKVSVTASVYKVYVYAGGSLMVTYAATAGKTYTNADLPPATDVNTFLLTAKPGYKFAGTWSGNYTNIQSDTYIYADISPITYTIGYTLNGGTNNSSNPGTYTVEDEVVLKDPTRASYIFKGWYTNSSFTGDAVTKIEKGTIGNKTFYAKWEAAAVPQYTVTFKGKDGSTLKTETVDKGSSATAPTAPTIPGYEFTGWDKDFSNVTANLTVTAKYQVITYNITYELNGGTNGSNPATYTVETATITLKNATKTGYTFTGWYENSSCTGTSVTQIVKGSTGDKKFYAGFDEIPEEFTVTFKGHDGKTLKTEKVKEGQSATAPAIPERKGYTANGWDKDFTNVTSNLTVTAQYKVITYNITYVLNDGTHSGNPATYTIETADITLNPATKAKHSFIGWFENPECTGTPVEKITQGSMGDKTFYAGFSANEYTVTFVGFGGKVIREDKVLEGQSTTAPEAPVITGYHFQNWSGNYSNVVKNEIVTANYSPITYSINYVYNNGSNPGNPGSYTIESERITLKESTRNGYRFAGWYDNAAFEGNPITEIVTGSYGNLTLYARFINEKGLWLQWKGLREDAELTVKYTGKAIKPEFTVYYGDKELVLGTDYTVSYKNNTNANELITDAQLKKAPAVVIKGKGNYTGSVEATFKISPKQLIESDISVLPFSAAYNKRVQKGVPVVMWDTKKLVAKKDYTVEYLATGDNAYKEVGQYEVKITGNGNYAGEVRTYVNIIDDKATDGSAKRLMSKAKVKAIPAITYTGNYINLESLGYPVVTFGKETLVCGTDYELIYNRNIRDIGTYSVVVRGKGKYVGEVATKYQVKGMAASTMKVSIAPQTYTGNLITPKPVITDKAGNPLQENVHYKLSYANNLNAGNGQVIITGIGNYTGIVKKSFKISPRTFDDGKNSGKLSYRFANNSTVQTYEKAGAKPKLVLTYDGKTLIEGTDYTLSYKNNTKITEDNVKQPEVTVTGKKNFSGKITLNFSIVKADIGKVKMTAPDMQENARPGKYLSNPVLTDANGKRLAKGTDYEKTIIYKDINGTVLDKNSRPVAGDVVTVVVTGKGAYTGTKECTFRIYAKGMSVQSASIKVLNKQYYSGEPIVLTKADLQVKVGKVILDADDYEIVEYTNNIKKGNAKVTIRGIGDYAGVKTFNLAIQPWKFTWWSSLLK